LIEIISKTDGKITFHVFDPDYPITYYFECEWWFKNGKMDATFKRLYFHELTNLLHTKEQMITLIWFIFLYNGRKEICGVAEKVLNKDNPEVLGIFKYFLVLY
jgi:hypothetical protein